jgi:hypothetical protein
MRLIYVNEIGADYKGQKQYEFIFSASQEIDMDEWFVIPSSSSSRSKSPEIEYIDLVGLLKNTDLDLELVQNSDYFGVIDAVDGVIALGWEKFDITNDSPRVTFKFGETIESVNKKLKNKGFSLLTEEVKANDI